MLSLIPGTYEEHNKLVVLALWLLLLYVNASNSTARPSFLCRGSDSVGSDRVKGSRPFSKLVSDSNAGGSQTTFWEVLHSRNPSLSGHEGFRALG